MLTRQWPQWAQLEEALAREQHESGALVRQINQLLDMPATETLVLDHFCVARARLTHDACRAWIKEE